MDHYYTISQDSFAEFKDRGSRFLAYAFPVGSVIEVKAKVQALKKEHPKAAHHCYAYRLGFDENNFRAVDDGEPAGTAGKPILGQIDSRKLTQVCIVVVRYFGGTLLGVPGLINAYKTAASLSLQIVPIVLKPILKHIKLEFDYTRMNEVRHVLKQYNCEVISQSQGMFCQIEAGIPLRIYDQLFLYLSSMHNVEVKAL